MDFVTFSRELGTGGGEIAEQVAKKLGYNFIDTKAIEKTARDMGFLESVEEVDERTPSFFRRFLSHKPSIELDRLNSIIYELARQGNTVFLGRGGQILLNSFDCALHVRVVASRPKRVQNLMEKGYAKEAAVKAIEKSDHERSSFIRFAFKREWDDPRLYDLVLNMDKLSVNLAIEAILAIAHSDEIKACTMDSLQSIGMMALADRAEAAIIEAGLSWGQTYSVSVTVPEPGKVRLTGLVEEEGAKKRAEGVVNLVKGVEAIDNQIRVSKADRHA
jgi:cytidylate kinase